MMPCRQQCIADQQKTPFRSFRKYIKSITKHVQKEKESFGVVVLIFVKIIEKIFLFFKKTMEQA
jgi:hypothetical protein